jgi:hypothetical protein
MKSWTIIDDKLEQMGAEGITDLYYAERLSLGAKLM